MSGTQTKQQAVQGPIPNLDVHVKDMNDRFARLAKQLGTNNKAGTFRHDFEVDFSYALHDLKMCPIYMQPKKFEQAQAVVTSLINHLKKPQPEIGS